MGKWLPYNQDGSVHECKSKDGGKNSVSNNGNGNDLSLEVVLRKLESILLTRMTIYPVIEPLSYTYVKNHV